MDIKHQQQQQQQIFPDGEWDFSRMFSMEELPDFTTELLGHCVFPFGNYEEKSNSSIPSAFFPNPEANNVQQSIDAANESSLFYFMSQENSNSSNFSLENTHFVTNSNHIDQATDHYNSDPMDFCIMDQKNNTGSFMPVLLREIAMSGMTNNRNENLGTNHQQEVNAVAIQEFQLKRKVDSEVNPSKNVKKKARVTRDVQKGKKSDEKLNKNQKLTTTQSSYDLEDQERSNVNGGAAEGLSSSSYCSEDDNASQDSNSDHSKIPETNRNSKKRASRGSATDPQSLYARKRRERINERLRILQNLVPNGTKVDISTMLEEAVHYVKFLKIQIKLLSSDDLWMYAPIAYNGMDIGLNHKIAMML